MLNCAGGRARIKRHPGLGARGSDRLQAAVNMRASFDMGGNHIRTGLGKCLDIRINRSNHQMHIHHRFDMRPDRGTGCRAKCDIRHKMPIHDVDMNPIGAFCLNTADFFSKVGKIRRED